VTETLIQIFLGWPAILFSLGLAIAGILSKRTVSSLMSGVLMLPPAWYLSHYSAMFWFLPVLLFGSAYAISRDKVEYGILLIIPVLVATAGLGAVVLSQHVR
jgi:hypothetical protein